MFGNDLGIDLGTANTLVYLKGKGIIVNEPSVVAIDTVKQNVLAVGNEAKDMIGRTPGNIVAIRPMKDGVIADFDVTQAMLKYFIKKAVNTNMFSRPRVVVCVPSGVTEVERRAIIEATIASGAKEKNAFLIEEPMAAAIGAGLPVSEPTGSMIVDIGGGTSEVAVISLSGVVTCKSLRVAGDSLDNSIITYVKKKFNLAIGDRTAERVKMEIASVYDPDENVKMNITGRDLVTGLPKVIEITQVDAQEAMSESISAIIDAIKFTLERTPPELSADVIESGIVLAGGGAQIKGLGELITANTNIFVRVAENPLDCVANGIGKVLEDLDGMKNILITHRNLRM